jgi:dCTP deaminase
MILTGDEIRSEHSRGRITIDPFDVSQLNPNSYNYRLASEVKYCVDSALDPEQPGCWSAIRIPEAGLVLEPHMLYLGVTVERIGSAAYVTSLIGRSSLGRLGMFLQASADLGNLGAIHCWTLEIKVVQRLRIYANMLAGQVSFWKSIGDVRLYSGGYDSFSVATPSQRQIRSMHRE